MSGKRVFCQNFRPCGAFIVLLRNSLFFIKNSLKTRLKLIFFLPFFNFRRIGVFLRLRFLDIGDILGVFLVRFFLIQNI